MSDARPLHDTLGVAEADWPEDIPTGLEALLDVPRHVIADAPWPDGLAERVLSLRAHAIAVKQSASGDDGRIASPQTAHELLVSRRLACLRGRWVTYVLDRDRARIPERGGGERTSRYRLHVSRGVPRADELPPVPDGGATLVIYGGGTEILAEDDVPPKLGKLSTAVPVADVLLHDRRAHPPATTSLRAAADCGGRCEDAERCHHRGIADPGTVLNAVVVPDPKGPR